MINFGHGLPLTEQMVTFAIMYLDSRDDPQNLLSNCYVASYSNDGGDTWIDRRVGDVGSDLRRNPSKAMHLPVIIGCAFHNGMIYPSWVDMRNATTGTDNDTYGNCQHAGAQSC